MRSVFDEYFLGENWSAKINKRLVSINKKEENRPIKDYAPARGPENPIKLSSSSTSILHSN